VCVGAEGRGGQPAFPRESPGVGIAAVHPKRRPGGRGERPPPRDDASYAAALSLGPARRGFDTAPEVPGRVRSVGGDGPSGTSGVSVDKGIEVGAADADAASDPDRRQRAGFDPVFQHTRSAHRGLPAAEFRAARCVFSARHTCGARLTVTPGTDSKVPQHQPGRPELRACRLGRSASSLKRVRQALRGVRDHSEGVCQLRLISGVGGTRRVRQRAG